MFEFLKNKLKEWSKKAKESLKAEEKLEPSEEKIESKEKGKREKGKKQKKERTKDKSQEIQEILPPLEEKEVLEEKEFVLTKEIEESKTEKEVGSEKSPGLLQRIFGKKELQEIPKPEEKKKEEKKIFQLLKKGFEYKISEEDFNKLFEELETLLLENNVALEVVEELKKILSKKLVGKEIKKSELESEIKTELKNSLNELLLEPRNILELIKEKKEKPFVILFFGINGTGKTTSIAKIAHLLKNNNFSVVLAAADTFRAASIEQLTEHANNLKIPIIKHNYQSDPAAVGFDAIKHAKSHYIDVVLIDTAGRMYTKADLLAEMEKICRVTKPDLKIFVAESIAGNDAIEQARTFNEAIGIDGSILSKADVDEKGGTVISISYITKKPIFYLGTGQNYSDLKLFSKEDFMKSLDL